MNDDTKEHHSKERTKAEAQFRQAQKPQSLLPRRLPTADGPRRTMSLLAKPNAPRLRALRLAKEVADKKKS